MQRLKHFSYFLLFINVLLFSTVGCGTDVSTSDEKPIQIPEDKVEQSVSEQFKEPVKPLNSFSVSQICKAGIAVLMGQEPSIIKTSEQEGIVLLSYTRPDDGSEWKYRCRIKDGQRIIWASDTGRWRDDPADEQLFFRVSEEDSTLEIEERYEDGSSVLETFDHSQLGS
jgi:hypothetical protein